MEAILFEGAMGATRMLMQAPESGDNIVPCASGVPNCDSVDAGEECALYNGYYLDPQNLQWVIALSAIVAIVMALGIGANDAANSWATTVGSGALPLRFAILLGGIMEWAGAVSLGYGVAKTVTKGTAKVTDPDCYACGYCDSHMTVYMIGMMSALFAAAIFLFLCTFTGMPVSTTHAIIGAVVGSTISGVGFGCLKWKFDGGLSGIMASWVISPVASGVIGLLMYLATDWLILHPRDFMKRLGMGNPRVNAVVGQPILFGLQTFVIVFLILIKSKPTKKWELKKQGLIALAIGAAVLVLSTIIWVPFIRYMLPSARKKRLEEAGGKIEEYNPDGAWGALYKFGKWLLFSNEPFIYARDLISCGGLATCCLTPKAKKQLADSKNGSSPAASQSKPAEAAASGTEDIESAAAPAAVEMTAEGDGEAAPPPADRDANVAAEKARANELAAGLPTTDWNKNAELKAAAVGGVARTVTVTSPEEEDPDYTDALWTFSYLLVFTAAWESYAHGANDTGNATGAFTGVLTTFENGLGSSATCKKGETEVWVMAIAGFCVFLGVVLLGYRVIKTIGFQLTDINYQRGYCVEFGSTLSVVIATILEMPVSTTHAQVGAVMFVGVGAFGFRNVSWGLFVRIALSWVLTLPLAALISGTFTAIFRQAIIA